ncbi:MAG: NAD(P)H-binding protein [Vicinamibacterales bacterium]
MPRITVLGATGALGSTVARLALQAGADLSVLVRRADRLAPDLRARAHVLEADIRQMPSGALAAFASGHTALISCAGFVTEGEQFVSLVDTIVSELESLDAAAGPVCWFLAGLGLLDLDATGRRGVDLPPVRATYWPHDSNYQRLLRSPLDWRLLCPGPMVDAPAVGVSSLRVSVDRLPTPMPDDAAALTVEGLMPLFGARIPEMIIPYADAAAFMLTNTTAHGAFTHKRVGLALPEGMRGHEEQWTAATPGRT